MPGVVGRTRVEHRGRSLTLVLPADLAPLAAAASSTAVSAISQLACIEPAIVVE